VVPHHFEVRIIQAISTAWRRVCVVSGGFGAMRRHGLEVSAYGLVTVQFDHAHQQRCTAGQRFK
jgi:hypothetical protein